jgi:hypothetical protein
MEISVVLSQGVCLLHQLFYFSANVLHLRSDLGWMVGDCVNERD